MNKTFPILCVISALFLTSCWHPPFDPLVSASEFTAKKLGDPVWSKTVTLRDEAAGGYYLPSRDPSEYYTGAWIRRQSGRISIGKLTMLPGTGFNFNANRYNAADTFGSSAVLVNPPGSNTTNSIFYVASNADGIYQLNTASSAVWPPLLPIIGFGVSPSNTTQDIYYIAEWNGIVISVEYAQTGIVLGMPPAGNGTITFTVACPIPVGPAFLAASPVNLANYYLSGPMANGNSETYFWATNIVSPILLPISRKLTGMLSDGRLLADTGDELYVYSADGTDSFSIPTGVLRFVHERTPDGITWYSVFTRTIAVPNGKKSDGSDYLIQIYEIPTANLRDLAD